MNLKAIRYLNWDEMEAAGNKPGSIAFTGAYGDRSRVTGLEFLCPCCGTPGYLNFDPDSPGPCWKWNGNKDKPTVTPSIFNTGMPCRWHGFLNDGEFRSV